MVDEKASKTDLQKGRGMELLTDQRKVQPKESGKRQSMGLHWVQHLEHLLGQWTDCLKWSQVHLMD
jgi:hypothetical protein